VRNSEVATSDGSLVKFFSSFAQGGYFCTILEYVNDATLDDYFQTVTPPSTPQDIFTFWESLLNLSQTLVNMNEAMPPQFDGNPYAHYASPFMESFC